MGGVVTKFGSNLFRLLGIIQLSEKIDENILGQNFFKPSLPEAYASSELLRTHSYEVDLTLLILAISFQVWMWPIFVPRTFGIRLKKA